MTNSADYISSSTKIILQKSVVLALTANLSVGTGTNFGGTDEVCRREEDDASSNRQKRSRATPASNSERVDFP